MTNPHIPVLCEEVLNSLDIHPQDIVFDGTLGFGGHAKLILDKLGPKGLYIGCDQDVKAINFCDRTLIPDYPQLHLIHHNFSDFEHILSAYTLPKPNKVLLDLGFSSYQLDKSNRGFSHLREEPLDMRMDKSQSLTAREILNTYTEKDLSDMFFYYGDLYQNKRLVHNILTFRKKHPLSTTTELIELIKKSFFFNNQRPKFMRTCAQVFQAIRIEVNDEIGTLERILNALATQLEPGAQIAIITFQPLEDRTIRSFLKETSHLEKATKKPLKASQDEIKQNSRSKSAKLWHLIKT